VERKFFEDGIYTRLASRHEKRIERNGDECVKYLVRFCLENKTKFYFLKRGNRTFWTCLVRNDAQLIRRLNETTSAFGGRSTGRIRYGPQTRDVAEKFRNVNGSNASSVIRESRCVDTRKTITCFIPSTDRVRHPDVIIRSAFDRVEDRCCVYATRYSARRFRIKNSVTHIM